MMTKNRALIKLCKDLFGSHVIGTDFDDVQVLLVKKRNFLQQSDGAGLHISFSVSWDAIGKVGKEGHDALDAFEPERGWD